MWQSMHKAFLLHSKGQWMTHCTMLRTFFLMKYYFSLERNYGYPDLSIWQTFSWERMKWACHLKENNWQYFWPMIKFELSSYKSEFWKHVSATTNLITFEYRPQCKMKMWGPCWKSKKKSAIKFTNIESFFPSSIVSLIFCSSWYFLFAT